MKKILYGTGLSILLFGLVVVPNLNADELKADTDLTKVEPVSNEYENEGGAELSFDIEIDDDGTESYQINGSEVSKEEFEEQGITLETGDGVTVTSSGEYYTTQETK